MNNIRPNNNIKELELIRDGQKELYSLPWGKSEWRGERLFPVMLSLSDVLRGTTAREHIPYHPESFNVLGAPRSGTKWMVSLVERLLNEDICLKISKLVKSIIGRRPVVHHLHEGVLDDFKSNQKILFIYRDVRDCVVSGYHYIRNGLHQGTMGCTTEVYKELSKEEGLERQLIMYMKYRMPVIDYWFSLSDPRICKIRYEDIVRNPVKEIERIVNCFGLKIANEKIQRISDETSFHKMSGRKSGIENQLSHQRKGICGDWKNHFSVKHKEIFKQMGGEEFLAKLGYEVDSA